MTLGDFHQLMADSLRRGTTLSTQIVGHTKLAAQWLERNYTFKYMENFRLFQLVSGSRTLELPSNATIKSHKFVRLIGTDGVYTKLNRVEPEDLGGIRTATNGFANNTMPSQYWTVGNSLLVFDSILTEDYNGEAMFHQYSAWPVDATETHPLLDFAADVLLQQTLLFMAAFLKDAEMAAAYKTLRDEAVNTLVRAEDENKFSGESVSMVYRGG